MATNVNSVINSYTYTYNNQLRPKLDKDNDGTWNKSELQNYADAYKKATSKTLDVDKLIEKYGNEDGVIDAKGQDKMWKDDALGFSVLQGAASSTSSTTSSTSTTGTTSTTAASMSLEKKAAIYDAVRAFTFDYSGKLQPVLDKDKDGMWSREELQNYANAYKKATGNVLDVDKLMEQYGNENGYIDPTNQAKMKSADALGLSALKTAFDKANAAPTVTYNDAKAASSKKTGSYSLEELLNTMSPSGKAYFSVMTNKLNSQSALLDNFTATSTSSGSFDMLNLLSSRNTLQMYKAMGSGALSSAMSGQLMNFTL